MQQLLKRIYHHHLLYNCVVSILLYFYHNILEIYYHLLLLNQTLQLDGLVLPRLELFGNGEPADNIDQWAISQDERLLHWGPITETVSEWADLRKEAEAHAKEATGLTRKRLCRASNDDRSKWRNAYNEYVQDFITGGPVGWYASETILDDIIDQAIRLS